MEMIINGKRVQASDGVMIDVVNPATHVVIDTIPDATEEDIAVALCAAQEGKKVWGSTPVEERVRILRKAADLMDEECEEIANILCEEEGKPYQQALNEVRGASGLYRGYADKIRHYYGSVLPEVGEDMIQIVHEPLGVVVCVIPFNFPVDLYVHKTAPALAAGNAVIVKPATETPLANIYMTDLLIRAGVPGSAIQIVTGRGSQAGNMLCASKLIDGISMTGSTSVGISIGKLAMENMTHTSLELGGNDPFVVLEDADLELSVRQAVDNRMLNAGQTCCAPKRFLVHNSLKEEFTKRVVEEVSKVKVGDPYAEDTGMGPLVSEAAAERVHEQVQYTIGQGAVCVCGGEIVDKSFYQPTVLTNVTPDMDIAKDLEIFGPVMPIIGFDTDEEALEMVNSSVFGLSGGVMSKDWKRAMRFARRVESGTVVINGAGLYRTQDMPFGGYKMSGIGGEGFFNTLDEMHRTKSIVWKGILE